MADVGPRGGYECYRVAAASRHGFPHFQAESAEQLGRAEEFGDGRSFSPKTENPGPGSRSGRYQIQQLTFAVAALDAAGRIIPELLAVATPGAISSVARRRR